MENPPKSFFGKSSRNLKSSAGDSRSEPTCPARVCREPSPTSRCVSDTRSASTRLQHAWLFAPTSISVAKRYVHLITIAYSARLICIKHFKHDRSLRPRELRRMCQRLASHPNVTIVSRAATISCMPLSNETVFILGASAIAIATHRPLGRGRIDDHALQYHHRPSAFCQICL